MATILNVTDEPALAGLMQKVLSYAGHTVLTAQSAQHAFSLIRELGSRNISPQLLITDLHLNREKNPGESCRLIIQVRGQLGIPVILSTGAPEEIPETELQLYGVTSVLTKPFKNITLVRSVQKALSMQHPWML